MASVSSVLREALAKGPLGPRSDNVVLIQIITNNARTVEQKKALFRRVAELLSESPVDADDPRRFYYWRQSGRKRPGGEPQ